MMKRCLPILLMLAALCAAGCAVSLATKHAAIQKGMTKTEVLGILGRGKLSKVIYPYCPSCRKIIKRDSYSLIATGETPPLCPTCRTQTIPEEWWWYFGHNKHLGMGAQLIEIQFWTNGTVRYKELSDL